MPTPTLKYVFNMHIKTSVANGKLKLYNFHFALNVAHVWENVNLNTEIHCHFAYYIANRILLSYQSRLLGWG